MSEVMKSSHIEDILVKLTALYNFSGDQDELNLIAGDTYYLLRDEGDWLYARNKDGLQGFIPSSYVESEDNEISILQKETEEYARRKSSSPLHFKFHRALMLKHPVQAISCTDNFVVVSSVQHVYVFDMKKQVLFHEDRRLSYERISFFRKKDGFEEFLCSNDRFDRSGNVDLLRVGYVGSSKLVIEKKELVGAQNGRKPTYFLSPVGDTHAVYLFSFAQALPTYLRFHEIPRFDMPTKLMKKMDFTFFTGYKYFQFVRFFERSSEVVILYCSNVVQLFFIPVGKDGFPIKKREIYNSQQQQQNGNNGRVEKSIKFGGAEIRRSEGVARGINSITDYEMDVLTLNNSASPNREKVGIYVFFKILQKKNLCVVTEYPDNPNSQHIYLVNILSREIQRTLDVDFGFQSFEVIDDKYLWYPKIPETEEKMKESHGMLFQVGNLNISDDVGEVQDDLDFRIIIPTPFSANFNHGLFVSLVLAETERGDEKGARLIVWKIDTSGSDDGLFLERVEYLRDREKMVAGFVSLKICDVEEFCFPKILVL